MNIPQQIDFRGRLEEDDGAAMFFTAEFFFIFINCHRII